MGEMTPLTAEQVAQFRANGYDAEAFQLPRVKVPRRKRTDAEKISAFGRKVNSNFGKIKNASGQMAVAAALLGIQSKELTYTAASFEVLAGAMEAYSALRALKEAMAAGKIAEGIAQLAKYHLAAPIVAAAAIGAAIAVNEQMNNAVRQVDIEGDFSTPAGVRDLQARVSGLGWS